MELIFVAIFKVHHEVELETAVVDQTEKITQTLRQSVRGMVNNRRLATNMIWVSLCILLDQWYPLKHVHVCDAEMLLWRTLLAIPQIIFTFVRIQIFLVG